MWILRVISVPNSEKVTFSLAFFINICQFLSFLGTPWAYLFSSMEAAKNEYPALSDYSVSETTLEQVFLSFAKDKRKLPSDQ